ncbi:hypothetical protein ACS0TY_003363 [Phlomoides rotata]
MLGCSTSTSADPKHCDAPADCSNLIETSDHTLQHENEVDEGKRQDEGNGNEEEDEDEDADFNPFLKETNSLEASSSLSSEVEDLDLDVAHSTGNDCVAFDNKKENIGDIMKDFCSSGNVEFGEEVVMQNTVSDTAYATITNKESALITQSENGSLFDKENGATGLTDVSNAAQSRKTMVDLDTEDAICMRTRARYSLASFTLDDLETFLQETDDEDDLQNVDDEDEYKKFLAAVIRGDNSPNVQENANDDEDEENDADFELELEEALESEPEEAEARRMSRRNRCRKASFERSKKLSEQFKRPLRPLVPFASIGSFPGFDGKQFTPNISPSNVPPVNNGYSCGFTPHQIGQLHCLIHEHVQLLIQVFSLSVLEPGKSQIASEVKELVVQMHKNCDQALAWRTVPYPSFCFFPPYIHPSVSDGPQKILPSDGNNKYAQQNFPSGSNRAMQTDISSMSNERHNYLPDEQGVSSETPGCSSWMPYIRGPVVSVMDVAPLRLVENYMDEVSSAARAYQQYQIELGYEAQCQREPLFPPRNSLCSVESDGQGETENIPPDSSEISHSSRNQKPKKTMAASLLEKAKSQSVALVPKEIATLARRFSSLFNPALYPHKPPPAPIANRVLFTDAEDELLALGLVEYNTDWKAIQQRYLPCKSRHQIFVRQKNRASSKAPENPIKAVRTIKNSPLTPGEIARIEVGLKKFKLDWISIWRFFVPYRDPSLLPRQWRIATGTQKSYKSDANKKAKRHLYELRRKSSKPSLSTWQSSSEKEGDSSDNAIEGMDKEDEAYVHEAFLADWMPENNVSSGLPACLQSGEGPQAREHSDNSVYGDTQSSMFSKTPAALRSSNPQVVLRPYRARRPNAARLVRLAPDLPPVNLPPSVRVMSQSAFKSSKAATSANMVVEKHTRSIMNSGIGSSMKSGPTKNISVNITANSQHPNHPEVTIDVERGDSDLQMHPLLFQEPQDSDLCYYPSSTSTSRSLAFFPGKQPQLSLSLFHNPRHIRDAVNFLSKSSMPPEKKASTSGVDFHPLLQRTDDVDADSITAHPSGRLLSVTESRQKCASTRNPSASTLDCTTSSASSTKLANLSGKSNKLDLNIHLSTSKNQEASDIRNKSPWGTGRSVGAPSSKFKEFESSVDSGKKKNSAPDGIARELNSSDNIPVVTSRSKGRREVSGKTQDESFPAIIMEQEELSDSDDDEFGGNVEFECEEMDDSEGDSTSDSEKVFNMPNELVHLDGTDSDIDDVRVLNTHEGANIVPDSPSLNLNCCPPAPVSNPKNSVSGIEFGPFGAVGIFGENTSHVQKGDKDDAREHLGVQKRAKDDEALELPRKRVCSSNSNSGIAVCVKGNVNSELSKI